MPLFKEIQQRLANLNTVLQENIAGVRVVKAFVREEHEARRYEAANREFYDVNIQVNNILSRWPFPPSLVCSNVATLAIYWIGGNQVIGGTLTIGELVAFASYIMMAFFPVLMMGMIIAMLSSAAASAERIFEILDAHSEVVEKPDARTLPPIEGRVAFRERHLSLLLRAGEPVLKNVSLDGRAGPDDRPAGRDRLGQVHHHQPDPALLRGLPRAACTIDGYDVRDVTLESLRAQIGIVLQETTLFEGTIRENIAFGRPDATLEEIIEAAKAAEAHDFITSFPEGYETRVGERGVTLSGGQKQRVAIARALLLDPKILILDDATSSVDLATEYRIQKALERLMQGRTSFVIAQRVATVLNADQILVLEKGEIVARGVHEELLASSEIYAEIYSSQLQDDRELRDDARRRGR